MLGKRIELYNDGKIIKTLVICDKSINHISPAELEEMKMKLHNGFQVNEQLSEEEKHIMTHMKLLMVKEEAAKHMRDNGDPQTQSKEIIEACGVLETVSAELEKQRLALYHATNKKHRGVK